MRKVVIVGPPPVQILDVTGPLEVFSSAGGYEVVLGNPGPERALRANRNIALAEALPIHEITRAIDTLVIAGGPGRKPEATTLSSSRGLPMPRSVPGASLRSAREHFCSAQPA